MSEEQRAAVTERLAAARIAKGHDGSKSVNENIRDMDEEHPLHWKKVREWIKEISIELKGKRNLKDSKVRTERSEYITLDIYLANLKNYLTSGVYDDNRYGRHREGKMNRVCTTMAYNLDGSPKRTVGTFYQDIGIVWTNEMKLGVYVDERC